MMRNINRHGIYARISQATLALSLIAGPVATGLGRLASGEIAWSAARPPRRGEQVFETCRLPCSADAYSGVT